MLQTRKKMRFLLNNSLNSLERLHIFAENFLMYCSTSQNIVKTHKQKPERKNRPPGTNAKVFRMAEIIVVLNDGRKTSENNFCYHFINSLFFKVQEAVKHSCNCSPSKKA